jgi:LysM repeat protein
MRVWVGDRLIIDQWYDHAAQTRVADVNLTAGDHRIKVEYYEAGGLASAKVSWALVQPPSSTQPPTTSGRTYTVQRGDTLAKIAQANGTTVSTLINLNVATYPSLRTNPNLIYAGWVLRLP